MFDKKIITALITASLMVTSVVPVFATPCLDRSLNTDGTTSYWNNNDYIWEDFDPVEVDGITGAYGPDGKFHPGFEYESGPVGEWDEPDDTYWIFSDGWYGPDPEQWESYQKWEDYINDSGEFSGNKHSHFYQYTEDDTYETNKGIDAYHDTSRLEYEFDRYTLHHTVKKDGKWVFVREDEDRPFVPEETPEYDSSSLNKMTVVSGKDLFKDNGTDMDSFEDYFHRTNENIILDVPNVEGSVAYDTCVAYDLVCNAVDSHTRTWCNHNGRLHESYGTYYGVSRHIRDYLVYENSDFAKHTGILLSNYLTYTDEELVELAKEKYGDDFDNGEKKEETSSKKTVSNNYSDTVAEVNGYKVSYPEKITFKDKKKASLRPEEVTVTAPDGSKVAVTKVKVKKATKVGQTTFKIKVNGVDKATKKALQKMAFPVEIVPYNVNFTGTDVIGIVRKGEKIKKVIVNGIKLKKGEYVISGKQIRFSGRFNGEGEIRE